jgi:hypothetical protein
MTGETHVRFDPASGHLSRFVRCLRRAHGGRRVDVAYASGGFKGARSIS